MSDLLKTINAAVPAGYRAIDYRPPKKGELHLNQLGVITLANNDYVSSFLILEREIELPDWIKSGSWVFKFHHGLWGLTESEPILGENYWRVGSTTSCLYPELFDTSWLPECSDWKQSKRQKP